MKVHYVVMAHIKRREYIGALLEQLPPDTSLSLDKGDLGLVQAHVQAWSMVDKTADYGCVIQDDVILTTDFIQKAQYHVEQGHKLYGKLSYHFYLRNKPTLAKYRNYDKDHVCLNGLYSGNSIALPTDWISPMLDSFAKSKQKGGDRKINEYLRRRGEPTYFPLPSLCEHRNIPSLHDLNTSPHQNRVALWFVP